MDSYSPSLIRRFFYWIRRVGEHLSIYWLLIKDFQTGLLLVTAAAGFITGGSTHTPYGSLGGLLGSLFLTISGCTILNMVYDRDIDASMVRTAQRPLPSGRIPVVEALGLGLIFSAAGLLWSFAIYLPYGLLVLLGWFLNVIVYTVWLKRRTPFSILVGGLAGGIPVLAGEVLAVGHVDEAGLLLMLAVLLWIPTHNLTFSLRHAQDYERVGIPTFPGVYGERTTRLVMAVSSLLAVVSMFTAAVLLSIPTLFLALLGILGFGLVGLAVAVLLLPNPKLNFILFRGASLYMTAAMLLLILSGLF